MLTDISKLTEEEILAPVTTIPMFDTDCLHYPIKAIIEDVSAAHEYAPINLLSCILPAITGVCGNRSSIRINSEWLEPFSLYTAIVANPGSRKNMAINFAIKPLLQIQARNMAINQASLDDYNHELSLYLKTNRKIHNTTPPKQPKTLTLTLQNATAEVLGRRLQDNQDGVVFAMDELDIWLSSLNLYKGQGKGSDRNIYLQGWDYWSASQIDRVSSPPIFVPRTRISIFGALTPETLNKLISNHSGSGLAARFLFALANNTPPIPYAIKKQSHNINHHIIQFQNIISKIHSNSIPPEFILSKNADSLFEHYYDTLRKISANSNSNSLLTQTISKMHGTTIRIAAALEIISSSNPYISSNSISSAIHISLHFLASLKFILSNNFSHSHKISQSLDEKILNFLNQHKSATFRDIYKHLHVDAKLVVTTLHSLQALHSIKISKNIASIN